MSFITQRNTPNCGAFAIAYYRWLKQGPPALDTSAQADEVKKITDAILFGNDSPVWGSRPLFADYCDPVKMILYLMKELSVDPAKIRFYSGEAGNPVDSLLNLMLAGPEGGIIRDWQGKGMVVPGPVPEDFSGTLLSLCYALCRKTLDSEKTLPIALLTDFRAVHYTLVEKNTLAIRAMNSWDGEFIDGRDFFHDLRLLKTGPDAEKNDSPNYNRLQFLHAGIAINN